MEFDTEQDPLTSQHFIDEPSSQTLFSSTSEHLSASDYSNLENAEAKVDQFFNRDILAETQEREKAIGLLTESTISMLG